MNNLASILSNASIAIQRFRLSPDQSAALLRYISTHESEQKEPTFFLFPEDPLVSEALMYYINHGTGYYIGEQQL